MNEIEDKCYWIPQGNYHYLITCPDNFGGLLEYHRNLKKTMSEGSVRCRLCKRIVETQNIPDAVIKKYK